MYALIAKKVILNFSFLLDYVLGSNSKCHELVAGCANYSIIDNLISCDACEDTYYRTQITQDLYTCLKCATGINSDWLRCAGSNDDPYYSKLQPT